MTAVSPLGGSGYQSEDQPGSTNIYDGGSLGDGPQYGFGSAGRGAPVDPNAYNYGGGAGGADYYTSQYNQMAQQAMQRQGAQINNQYDARDQSNAQGVMGQYGQLGNYYQGVLNGTRPSLANAQMQASTDQSINAQMAMANSSRGGLSGALAQRQAANQGSQMLQNAAQQSMIGRIQEEQGAAQGMSGMLQNQGQFALGEQNQNAQAAAQQAQLQQQQNAINSQANLGYSQLGQQVQGEQLQAHMQGQQAGLESYQQAMQDAQNNSQGVKDVIGTVGSTVGSVFSAISDRRLKTDVRNAGGTEADHFLASLHPSSYRYRNPADEPSPTPSGGRYLGVMAQDVERGPTGHTIVRDTPRGKMIDQVPAMSAVLAGLGRINERLSAIEHGNRGSSYADADLSEPNGPAHWTLREEPDFILAKNQRTGEMQKVLTGPLTDREFRQAMAPHGAGPLGANDPRRIRTVANDMTLGMQGLQKAYADLDMRSRAVAGRMGRY